MNYVDNVMYFDKVNGRIKCKFDSQKISKQAKKFISQNFKMNPNQKIIKAIVSKKVYIMLNDGIMLVFSDKSLLKNKIFKELYTEFEVLKIKYKLKKITKNAKFVLCKDIHSKIIPLILGATIIMSTEAININIGKLKINENSELNNKNQVVESVYIVDDVPTENSALEMQTFNTDKFLTQNFVYESFKDVSDIENNSDISENANILEDNINISETNYTENIDNNNLEYSEIEFTDSKTTSEQIANNCDYYSGDVYDKYATMMDNPQITSELNKKIDKYVSENLTGKMWGNAKYQGYNNYTIPEKFKNGVYTLNELFDSASEQFGVPKDILVSISQHECGQGYFVMDSYTGIYKKNCGGMMGYVDLPTNSALLPNDSYDGCDINTNPAISVYVYAATVRFFYDSFKDIDLGYGLDAWDISSYMIAIGAGYVTDPSVGFKYRYDYDIKGISQLNVCMPQFKSLREAYLNNKLGVNDLTFAAENGVVTHWADSEKFYYRNGEFTYNKFDNSNSYNR